MMETKQIALFDVAGTLVAGNPWRGILKDPHIPRWRLYALYPVMLPPWWAKNLGLLPDTRFRQIWIRQMAWLLSGLSRDEVRTVFDWIVREYMKDNYQQDVVSKLKAHKADGAHVVLISGMFTEFTEAFADYLGADGAVGTKLGFREDGICTGRIIGEGCAGQLKPIFLNEYLAEQGLSLDSTEVFTYADSFSDVPLLELGQTATVTYPDAQLATVAASRGWARIPTAN